MTIRPAKALLTVGMCAAAVLAPVVVDGAQPASAAQLCHYYASPHPTVTYGDTGDTVEQLQFGLSIAGYPTACDGVFGPKTRTSVLKFQRAHHLVADDVVGPKTWAALNSVVKSRS